MEDDIWRIRKAVEASEEKLKELYESLSESLEYSVDLSEVLEELQKVRNELELQRKGVRGFCQKHGYTYLVWQRGKGWRCAECIKETEEK